MKVTWDPFPKFNRCLARKEKKSAPTDNFNRNNKTVEEVKEEKELGDELVDGLNSVECMGATELDTRTSRNDNKKDESVR